MKKFFVLGGIALLVLNAAIAQNRVAPRERFGANAAQVLRQLNLTDAQRKDFQDLRFDLQKKSVEQQAKLKTARLELAQLFKADNPDKSAIEKKMSEITQFQSQQRALFVDHWFAVNKILTADQQKVWKRALERFVAQRRDRMMHGRGAQFMPGARNRFRMQRAPGGMGR